MRAARRRRDAGRKSIANDLRYLTKRVRTTAKYYDTHPDSEYARTLADRAYITFYMAFDYSKGGY